MCHQFALEGATVAFTYVRGQEDKDAVDTVNMLKEVKTVHAKDPIKISADLGFDENCKKVIDDVVKAYGQIDILVNNAAEQYPVPNIEDLDSKKLERDGRDIAGFQREWGCKHGV